MSQKTVSVQKPKGRAHVKRTQELSWKSSRWVNSDQFEPKKKNDIVLEYNSKYKTSKQKHNDINIEKQKRDTSYLQNST